MKTLINFTRVITADSRKYKKGISKGSEVSLHTELTDKDYDMAGLLSKELTSLAFAYSKEVEYNIDAETGMLDDESKANLCAYINNQIHGSLLSKDTKDRAAVACVEILKKRGRTNAVISFVKKHIKNATVRTVQLLNLQSPTSAESIRDLLHEAGQIELHGMWSSAMESELEVELDGEI